MYKYGRRRKNDRCEVQCLWKKYADAYLKGASKKKTTDEELHHAGRKAFEVLERKFKVK